MKNPCKYCASLQKQYCGGCERYLEYLKQKSKKIRKEEKRVIKFLKEKRAMDENLEKAWKLIKKEI
jgi:predicted Fe-S protein YdhL (DUF1289 family)